MTAEAKAEVESGPTKRVVLTGFTVEAKDLPEDVRKHPLVKAGKVEVWIPVAEVEGEKRKVIDSTAKTKDGDEIAGRYRAPSHRSWKGGVELDPPSQLKLDRKPID